MKNLPLAPTTVDAAGLHAALAEAISGEVRFDRLSRALYSTDASVYQIIPLGVVIPRTEADVVATVKTCARFGVPLTARGGGTSQAGQAIGPGMQLDCSKYFNEVLEINPAERWARVRPGCVLDDLNRAVRSHGLQFAPDISTSNRATIGGMVANNSSGTHSLIHGKTLDHVLELKVVLADGSVIHTRPLGEGEVEARCSLQDLEGECYRTVRRLAAEHAAEIERRYPKILRRVGGYNLDLFVPRGLDSGRVGLDSTSGNPHSGFGTQCSVPSTQHPVPSTQYSVLSTQHLPPTPPFNLSNLFVGSEGTLGVILEAKLRLVELPRAKGLLVIQFGDLLDALAATPAILEHRPSAVEVIDRYVLDSTRLNPEASRLRDFLQGDPAAVLIVEFFADRAENLPARLEALEADLRKRGHGDHYHLATEPAAQGRIWKLRQAALGLSMAEKGDAKAISFVEDAAVAPEHLRDYIAELLALVARHGTRAGVYAHASVGCLHVRPVIDLKTEAGVRQFEAIARETADLVLKYGGALSGEHGDGLVRSPFQEKMYGPALYQAFRELKRAFDPANLLNPGKIVDAPPLASNLRYGPAYVTPDVPTTFDFSADGGIARSAELCAGVGACRKKREGTMCPSYQATCEEQHSTRGRANALRLAITGQAGLDGLTDPAVREVLDLCLECKACKAECPTNVDMARLKAEFLHQYYRKHGLPLRNRVFGRIDRWSSRGCRLAPLSNWLARSRFARWLNERLLGIDSRRVPPAFARRTFLRNFTPRGTGGKPTTSLPRVLLFPDTFTNFYEPGLGMAAADILQRLGFHVWPGLPGGDGTKECGWAWPSPFLRCCGRPMISNGLLGEAVENARTNVQWLYHFAGAGVPIIACEPSCILTIRDDYPALLHGEERRQAEVVAAACRTFEEVVESVLADEGFILRGWVAKPALNLSAGPHTILVQHHCHQRSLVGPEPTLRLLRRIPGARVIDLDAGCCGMAGSFGYEKEHYEVSRLVGEQRLFPAVRSAEPDALIAAPGFSCRMQIEHFTGRKALHPAEILRAFLNSDEPRPG